MCNTVNLVFGGVNEMCTLLSSLSTERAEQTPGMINVAH